MLNLLAVVRHNGGNDTGAAIFAAVAFFGAIAISIGAIFYGKRLQRKRTTVLEQIAASLGLEFQRVGTIGFLTKYNSFGLFSRGRDRKSLNLLQGGSQDRQLAIFDYDYTTGHGRGTMRWHTTVLSLGLADAAIPYFFLRKKRITDTVSRWFRNKDIDVPGYPWFRRKFVLRGDNVDAVRSLFTEPVMDFFYRDPSLSAEGDRHTLVLYRLGKRVKPDAVNSFLSTGMEYVSLITARENVRQNR